MPVLRLHPVLWLLALFGLTSASAAQANYRQKAQEQTAYIQTHFYDAQAKKYHDTFPVNPKGLPWATMWGNGVQWRALVSAAQDNPALYRPVLDNYAQGLRQYWDMQPPQGTPPGFNAYCSGNGGTDKYYDDNAWLVLGYLEAYHAFHDPQYLQWARQTQTFVLSGWDDKLGGGIYWSLQHNGKNTCVNAPAAVGALQLAALGDPAQRVWALQILDWTNTHLKDTDGLYWDNIKLNGDIGKDKWTYNTALMIEADVLLLRQGNRQALQAAERSADAGIAAWQNPTTGAFANGANFSHLLCESLLQLYQTDHNIAYLNAVRRHAAFGDRYVRDAQNGGYWNDWKQTTHSPDERKSLLENASDARLFWLLAPYRDVDELYAQGIRALDAGHASDAQNLLQQAADSDTEAVEPRYHLWRLMLRRHETAAAEVQQQKLAEMGRDPKLLARLTALGWKALAPSP